MKILLVTIELGYRGTPRVLASYARILASRGHDVLVWGYSQGGETADFLKAKGFRVIVGCDAFDEATGFAPEILNIHHSGVYSRSTLELLKAFASRGTRCIETNVFGCVAPRFFPYLDASLQISLWDLWQWSRLKGPFLPDIGIYCPNPVDTEAFRRADSDAIAETRRSWGAPENAFVVGRAGKTDWRLLGKPLLDTLSACSDVHFVTVDDYNGAIPKEIASHAHVHLIGRLHDTQSLSRFYSACDACVSMSGIGESFGLVNAEAMLCGTPILALSTPLWQNAQPEMVVNGKGGFVMACPECLKECALRMVHDRVEHTRLSDNARNLIVSRYSFAEVGRILSAVMEGSAVGDLVRSVGDNSICALLKDVEGNPPWWTFAATRLRHSMPTRMALNGLRRLRR